jgi:2-polyprenyl-6-methoxyphenol hydroxylase-like FAD-dependent oxidoreductase
MSERCDVVIVGARCAGSPLAIQLARRNLKVVVVDRSTFPSDTPSTHFFQTEGIASLARMGVLDRLRATGAPFVNFAEMRVEGIERRLDWPVRPGDAGGAMAVRRPILDTILVEEAQKAGADVRTSTKLTGLVLEDGRVMGARVASRDGQETEVLAPLVVGADGRGSAVGDHVGARRYNVTRGERIFYWTYYENVASAPANTTWFHRWDEELAIGFPCDAGSFLVGVGPPLDRLARFNDDAQKAFDAHVAACAPLADLVLAPGVKRIDRLHRMTNVDGFLRESAGRGWALVGDAGHFKDPTPAQGISDALRQVDRLVPAIVDGLDGSETLDGSLDRWWRWRDEDAAEHHWFAAQLGQGGRVPSTFVEALRKMLDSPDGTNKFLDVLNHRTRPSQVTTPCVIVGAALRLLKRGDPPRRDTVRELGRLATEDRAHRKLNKQPAYVAPAAIVENYPEQDLATI